jgi:hypothetical protein
MKLHGYALDPKTEARVEIKNSKARVLITPSFGGGFTGLWNVSWEINHDCLAKVAGSFVMNSGKLWSAFVEESKDPAFTQYQGHWYRRGEFLNIPCPGTGRDGDPNLSILLNNEIFWAVRNLIMAYDKKAAS